jgi:hypothetical protein
VAGHVTHDRYGADITAGGSALYAAKTFEALGCEVAVATAFGASFRFGDLLAGFECFVSRSRDTTTFENTYPDDGPRLMLVEHPAATVRPDGLTEAWRAPDILFLAPVIGEVPLEAWLASTEPEKVGLGLQGFLKQEGPSHNSRGAATLAPRHFNPSLGLLERVSAVFLSREDIDGYADKGLLPLLIGATPLVAVTEGQRGATIYHREGAHHVGVRTTEALDPTGAGDTFAAGMLFGMAIGLSVEEAARLGAAAASVVVEARGLESVHRVVEAFELSREIALEKHTNQDGVVNETD